MRWDVWNKFKEEFLNKVKPLNYEEWKAVINNNFPEYLSIAEALVSVTSLLWFNDVDLPFALVLVGKPAGYKTTLLSFLSEASDPDLFYYTDKFTPKAFVTHISDIKKKEKIAKIDLLPKITNKVLITPELAPIFGSSESELKESMSILTRVLDGKGLTTDSGSQGRRGYRGNYKFMWLAATTPLPYSAWEAMGNFGTKMYLLNMPKVRRKKGDIRQMLKKSDFMERTRACRDATDRFVCFLKHKGRVDWDTSKENNKYIDVVVDLAVLLSRLRGAVNVHTREVYTEEGTVDKVQYTTPLVELPDRAAVMLYNLARGHAYIQGRSQISEDDLPLLIEVALSSAPYDRVKAFRTLLEYGGEIKTRELMEEIGCSRKTAIRAMNTLSILKLCTKEEDYTHRGFVGYKITLHDDLSWFLSKEFRKLWNVKMKERIDDIGTEKDTVDFFGGREGA